MEEGVKFEEKGQFDWDFGQPFGITKTIVAFANTLGGQIILKNVACDHARLDSARLTDFVNKWVAPKISGLSAEFVDDDQCLITVAPSDNAPHIFVKNANFKDSHGADKTAWHSGQVYARHSSKSEAANAEDLSRCIQNQVGQWLSKLGSAMESLSLDVREGTSSLTVSLGEGHGALKIGIADPNSDFPYITKTLGEMIGKSQNWTSQALYQLGCKENQIYSLTFTNSKGVVIMRRYNTRALDLLKAKLAEDATYDPYHL